MVKRLFVRLEPQTAIKELDVLGTIHFPCRDSKSSNLNNYLYIDVSGSRDFTTASS